MQGRLSPLVDGKIQAFPWMHWKEEFEAAHHIGLGLMEWTLDHEQLYQNPLLTSEGRTTISELSAQHGVSVKSVTGDCFMQAPFWKYSGHEQQMLLNEFVDIVNACSLIDIRYLVVPLVDHGSLTSLKEEEIFMGFIKEIASTLKELSVQIAIESDLSPAKLARFIDTVPEDTLGVNYDIGNSASFGHNPIDEFAAYGHRILNIHVKDRIKGGTTVALGLGNADFELVFNCIRKIKYGGNYILQTARSSNNNHSQVISENACFIENLLLDLA